MNVYSRHEIRSPYVTAFINTSVPTENDKTPLTSGSEDREVLVLPGWVCLLFFYGRGGWALLNNAVTIKDCIGSNVLLIDKSEKTYKKAVVT